MCKEEVNTAFSLRIDIETVAAAGAVIIFLSAALKQLIVGYLFSETTMPE